MLHDLPLLATQARLMELLSGKAWRIQELRTTVGHPLDNYEIDAALVHLCRAGLVSLDLTEHHYGEITVNAHAHRPRLPVR